MRVRRGSRYSSCASSTCSLASWLRARVEKMSRMTSGRSITRTLSSRSRLAPWTGLSSSSKMTSVAPASATARRHFLDLAFADERGRIGRRDLLRDAPHDLGAGGVHQAGELLEMLGHVPGVPRPLARGGHEYGTLDRIANLDRCSADGFWSSAAQRLVAARLHARSAERRAAFPVNGSSAVAERRLDRQLALELVRQLARAKRGLHRARPRPPTEPERQRQRGSVALSEI